ncbi:MAG: hypothetical protein AAGC55_27490, partial [Myxococcota bacterium]
LSAVADQPLCSLSRSLRRTAEFTVAASALADVMIFDEPDHGVGEREREWIQAKLTTLRGQCTAIVVTHNLRLASAVSDDAIFLLDGVIVESGATAPMFAQPRHERTRDLLTWGS